MTDDEAYAEADHVFLALVESSVLVAADRYVAARFKIDEVFKGSPHQVSELRAENYVNEWEAGSRIKGTCRTVHLSPGMRFIVFAKGSGPTWIGPCGPSRPYEEYGVVRGLRGMRNGDDT